MLTDNTALNWTARIALLAIVPAVAGGLWLFNQASAGTERPTAVATSCSGFEADAQKLFDQGNIAALSGTFAPGDRVQLAIDFEGAGHSWELTGVLAAAKKADVTGTGSFTTVTTSTRFTLSSMSARYRSSTRSVTAPTSTTMSLSEAQSSSDPTSTRGEISGRARLDLEIDVTTAGDGAIRINKTGSVPSLTAPRVASASCKASTPPTT